MEQNLNSTLSIALATFQVLSTHLGLRVIVLDPHIGHHIGVVIEYFNYHRKLHGTVLL